jgi:WW domain-containing oxidoreductase
MAKSTTFGASSTADQVIAGIDLNGKRMIVTGCSSGIGFETMSALAANGAHVIGLAPTFDEARDACAKVGYICTPLACDLSDLDSIAKAVQTIKEQYSSLDAVVANAGIANLRELNTRYGVERQFLVNYLGHFALLNGVAELIRDGSGRIVILSDHLALKNASPEGIMFDNLAGQRFYSPAVFYGQAKLANALHAQELARRLRPRGISVNTVNPGRVRGTRLYREDTLLQRLLRIAKWPFSKSQARGAATSVLLAGSPTVAGVTAEHWLDCKLVHANPLLENLDLAHRLWSVSEQIIRKSLPNVEALQQEAA